MTIHFVQHEYFEAPGALLNWAIQKKHDISWSKVYEYQPLPESVDHLDMLVVMGGPQSPNTTKKECAYFDAEAEKNLIAKVANSGKIVLGICLGAQLIGEAFGAGFLQSPEKEIGVWPIQLSKAGLMDDKIEHFGSVLSVGHWHNDMPGLTPKSRVLAKSTGCPRQIVAYDRLVYGFQCHMEFTKEVVEMLISEELDFLTRNTTHQFVRKPEVFRNHDFSEMNEMLFRFLDKLEAEYLYLSRSDENYETLI